MSLLQKIKNGKKNYKLVDFPGTTEKVAIVILPSSVISAVKINSDEYNKKNNIQDDVYKDITMQQYLVYEFLRDKDDQEKKVLESMDESRSLDVNELAYLVSEYHLFTQETSPFLNAIDEHDLETLKKTLETMSLKDLNGESLLSLRNFLMSLA